jgi:hypothetical protein
MQLINDLTQFSCVNDWLVQHADEMTGILAAEPWTQQQDGQPQEDLLQQQQQQVEKSVVLASQLLLQLLKHDSIGVAQRCSQLPAWLRLWLLGASPAVAQQAAGSIAPDGATATAAAAAASTLQATADADLTGITSAATYLSLLLCSDNVLQQMHGMDLLLHVAAAAPAEVLAAIMQPQQQRRSQQRSSSNSSSSVRWQQGGSARCCQLFSAGCLATSASVINPGSFGNNWQQQQQCWQNYCDARLLYYFSASVVHPAQQAAAATATAPATTAPVWLPSGLGPQDLPQSQTR